MPKPSSDAGAVTTGSPPFFSHCFNGSELPMRPRSATTPEQPNGAEETNWTEEDVVKLHCLLLLEVSRLADPATPLEEKFDTIRWIYTDPDKEDVPFSFRNCLKVAGCSPLSSMPYFGLVDVEEIRDRLSGMVRAWLKETIGRYPAWVQDAIQHNPDWIYRKLASNPQWINEQIKRVSKEGDLFA